jgi:ketosteroid isomerase-like protein
MSNADDRALIASANRDFYRALASRDMRMMEQVWLHEEWVGCVHPGWALLVGWKAVRQSWVNIFAGGQRLQTMPSQVVIHIEKDLAWVTCTENITAHDSGAWTYSVAQATNLFQRVDGEWKLIHHHASPMPAHGSSAPTDTSHN